MGGLYGSKWRKSLLEPITQSEVLMQSKFHAVSLNSKSYKELKEIQKLINDKDFLDKILLDGQKKAYDIASKKIRKMHEIIGF